MEKAEHGKLIISAAKSLKRFQLADPRIAALLYATSQAGRAGLFMSSLRHARNAGMDRVAMLAATEGFGYPEVVGALIPWFEANGVVHAKRESASGKILSLDSLTLTYDGLLAKVSEYYDALNPRTEDAGVILALETVSELPRLESEVAQKVARAIGEEPARTALGLAKNYKILASKSGKGLPEPILYSERVWARSIGKASQALAHLTKEDREALLALVDRVRRYQGVPESLIRHEAKQSNVECLVDLGLGTGLFNRTKIQMADGTTRAFLTSPHFFTDLESEYGEDTCDRVKIFLDSTRNGQHFGSPWTGRISNPDALLHKLLNTGIIGPCTAIGTDWVTSERAGIIRVERQDVKARNCYMKLVQKDVVAKVHELVTTGTVAPAANAMEASHIREGQEFRSIEETRVEAGEVPEPVAEAERAIMLTLREGR